MSKCSVDSKFWEICVLHNVIIGLNCNGKPSNGMVIMGSDGEWGTVASDCSQIYSMKRLFDAKTKKKHNKYHQRYACLQSRGSDRKCHVYKCKLLQNEWKLVCNCASCRLH
jgi:hypothetical protein